MRRTRRAMRLATTLCAAVVVAAAAVCCAGEASSSSHSSADSDLPPPPAASTLVSVQVVSRHGTRAPNPVVGELCPSLRPNLARYGDLRLTLAGLTGTGQKELYALGEFARQTYIERGLAGRGEDGKGKRGFLSDFFNDEEVYFRAVGEDRTIQSAVCMGHGMYPRGTAAIGYFADLPSPVPVYTLPDEMDSLLEVRKHGCAAQLKTDGALWDETEGRKLFADNEPLLQRMLDICNITDLNDQIEGTGDNFGDAIKDITDAWTFDMIEGFPPATPDLNYSSLLEFRTVAVKQLLGRIIGTEEQITYLNGELPERLVQNFQTAITNEGPNPASAQRLKMYAYHGHREMIYALGAFLGIEFDIKFPGLPKGAIPPATTLFFELHYNGPRGEDGRIPNPWEAAGSTNPYLHRMVKPEDMPKPHRWAETEEAETTAAAAATPLPATTSALHSSKHGAKHATKHDEKNASKVNASEPIVASRHGGPAIPLPQPPKNETEGESATPAALPPTESGEVSSGAQRVGEAVVAGEHAASTTTLPRPVHRRGSDELNGIKPEDSDASTAGQRHKASHNHSRSVLPRPRGEQHPHTGGFVKIPDDRMPLPPLDNYIVRAYLWHPCGDADLREAPIKGSSKDHHSSHAAHVADCPAVPVRMTAVCSGYDCPMQDFRDKMESRTRATGTWDRLCKVKPDQVRRITADVGAAQAALVAKDVLAVAAVPTATTEQVAASSHYFRWLLLALVCALSYAGFVHYRRRSEYAQPEEYVSFTQHEQDEQLESEPLQRVY